MCKVMLECNILLLERYFLRIKKRFQMRKTGRKMNLKGGVFFDILTKVEENISVLLELHLYTLFPPCTDCHLQDRPHSAIFMHQICIKYEVKFII